MSRCRPGQPLPRIPSVPPECFPSSSPATTFADPAPRRCSVLKASAVLFSSLPQPCRTCWCGNLPTAAPNVVGDMIWLPSAPIRVLRRTCRPCRGIVLQTKKPSRSGKSTGKTRCFSGFCLYFFRIRNQNLKDLKKGPKGPCQLGSL
jgi:hypothetical protein